MPLRRIPLDLFGTGFGLAGLAGCWRAVGQTGDAPTAVGEMLMGVSAIVWLLVLVLYLRYVFSVRGAFFADLQDLVAGPFSSLAVITPMQLAAQGLMPYSPDTAKVLVNFLVILTLVLGGWLTGQWIYNPFKVDQLHPGHFIPTVAGGLVARSPHLWSVSKDWPGPCSAPGSHMLVRPRLDDPVCFFFRPLLQPALLDPRHRSGSGGGGEACILRNEPRLPCDAMVRASRLLPEVQVHVAKVEVEPQVHASVGLGARQRLTNRIHLSDRHATSAHRTNRLTPRQPI